MIRRLSLCWLAWIMVVGVKGQADTLGYQGRFHLGSAVVPGVLTTFGFAALKWQALKDFDGQVRQRVWIDNPHGRTRLDNYIQYTPGLAVYALNALGVHGRHDLRDRSVIYLVANGIMGVAVIGLKRAINARRPDGSGSDGFPSGHTALAFTGAEFLAQEFRDVSPWIGIAGYTVAAGTGFLRIYNDKHWFSEVVGGAGIGILSAKAAYWLWPLIRKEMGWANKPEYKW